jgi:hypothetical protein
MGISWGYKYEINDFDKYDMDVQLEMFVVFFWRPWDISVPSSRKSWLVGWTDA